MPKSTSERAVFYNIPVGILVKKSTNIGTFEQLQEDMGWGDEITPQTTIGDALDITPLSKYVGDEQLERFKSLYELADDVTGETLYGEVRNIVDSKEKEFREAGNAEKEQLNKGRGMKKPRFFIYKEKVLCYTVSSNLIFWRKIG